MNPKRTLGTITLTEPADARGFKSRKLTEDEVRAVFGDAVYDALCEAKTLNRGRCVVVAIDTHTGTLTLDTTSAKPEDP